MQDKSDHYLKLFGRSIRLPRRRFMRVLLGVALILGGILGFLPILGFWMLPLGIFVLSHDSKAARRFSRKMAVKIGRIKANFRANRDSKQK
ncbi:hypothetical protein [Ahrensia sp. 13_GOM-1096m]|uniref:hypothetical protein n=1 Tax=Ahrensia sp. 13_GOM-1096m TaxID=1380380 RepID=UPI001FFEC579|nr:hypothetical protein [Ahrensia sp. 13_GOM-1096m]